MSLPIRIPIKCNNCGKDVPLNEAWVESLSRTRVCSEECHEEMQKKYCTELLRKS